MLDKIRGRIPGEVEHPDEFQNKSLEKFFYKLFKQFPGIH